MNNNNSNRKIKQHQHKTMNLKIYCNPNLGNSIITMYNVFLYYKEPTIKSMHFFWQIKTKLRLTKILSKKFLYNMPKLSTLRFIVFQIQEIQKLHFIMHFYINKSPHLNLYIFFLAKSMASEMQKQRENETKLDSQHTYLIQNR